MQGALLIACGTTVRGREAKSLESFSRALPCFEGLAKTGGIAGHREYFTLTGNSTPRSGFMIVEGEIEELQKVQIGDEYLRQAAEAVAIVDNVEVTRCGGGSDHAVGELIQRDTETMASPGYV